MGEAVAERRASRRQSIGDIAVECRDALFACARACGSYAGGPASSSGADAAAADLCAQSAGHCLTTFLLLETGGDPGSSIEALETCARLCEQSERACFGATTVSKRCAAAAESCRRCVECCGRLVEVVRDAG